MLFEKMEIIADKELFWFLKDGVSIGLSNKAFRNMYIQQVLSRGKTSDIKQLFKALNISEIKESFESIKNFLPKEVRPFWEEILGNSKLTSEIDN